jgi:molecular chaperone DnaJ
VRFKEVAEAYEILSNPDTRSRYDRYGHAGVQNNMGGGGGGFGGFHDAMDLFSQLFGVQTRRSRGGGQRGNDLRAVVEIDLLESAGGCTRDLEFDRQEICKTCKGSRAKPGTRSESCDYCGGQGQVVHPGLLRLFCSNHASVRQSRIRDDNPPVVLFLPVEIAEYDI